MRTAPITGLVTVTELPLPLDAVEPDPFITDLPVRSAAVPVARRRARPGA